MKFTIGIIGLLGGGATMRFLDKADDNAGGVTLTTEEKDTLLGGVNLREIRRGVAQTGALGYWIGARHARNGYTLGAVKQMIRFGFDRLGLHRLEAACLPENEPSRRLLFAAGFTQEGHARGYLKIDGRWRDHLLFGIVNPRD